MHPLLTIAKRAAFNAGDVIRNAFEQQDRIKISEKNPNDFVSNIDLASEQVLIDTILEAYPEHLIVSEERGEVGHQDSQYRWVIDPIDGTTNFVKGLPHFAISIAVYKDNKLEAALVYNPIIDEMFMAARGQGATLNDRKIRASSHILPANAVIATGIPYRHPELHASTITNLKQVLTTFPDIRRAGAASLDLCYVACGRVDGFYEKGLAEWDIAAGTLIAQESGAIVSDITGELTHLQTGNIIAAPAKVYKALVKCVK